MVRPDALDELNDAVPTLEFLEIKARARDGAIKLTPLDALPEPQNLGRLKKVIAEHWGTIPLIDAMQSDLNSPVLARCSPTFLGPLRSSAVMSLVTYAAK